MSNYQINGFIQVMYITIKCDAMLSNFMQTRNKTKQHKTLGKKILVSWNRKKVPVHLYRLLPCHPGCVWFIPPLHTSCFIVLFSTLFSLMILGQLVTRHFHYSLRLSCCFCFFTFCLVHDSFSRSNNISLLIWNIHDHSVLQGVEPSLMQVKTCTINSEQAPSRQSAKDVRGGQYCKRLWVSAVQKSVWSYQNCP